MPFPSHPGSSTSTEAQRGPTFIQSLLFSDSHGDPKWSSGILWNPILCPCHFLSLFSHIWRFPIHGGYLRTFKSSNFKSDFPYISMIKLIQLSGVALILFVEPPISLDIGSKAFSLLLTRLMEAFTTVASLAPKSDLRDQLRCLI